MLRRDLDGRQAPHDRVTETGGFHRGQSPGREAVRGGYPANLSLGIIVFGTHQGRRSPNRLADRFACLTGIQAQPGTPFRGGPHVTHGVGNATGSKRGSGQHPVQGYHERLPHPIEEADQLRNRIFRSRHRCQIRGALSYFHRRIGDGIGQLGKRSVTDEPRLQVLRPDAGSHRDGRLPAVIQYGGRFPDHRLHLPGFHRIKNKVGPANRFHIVRGGLQAQGLEFLQFFFVSCRDRQVRSRNGSAAGKSPCQGSAHVAGTDDGNFHRQLFLRQFSFKFSTFSEN